jgi:hypothetical protein
VATLAQAANVGMLGGTHGGHVHRELGQEAFTLRHAYDNGIRFFETSRSYPGLPEMLAMALKAVPRDSYRLMTKMTVSPCLDPARLIDQFRKQRQTDYFDNRLREIYQRVSPRRRNRFAQPPRLHRSSAPAAARSRVAPQLVVAQPLHATATVSQVNAVGRSAVILVRDIASLAYRTTPGPASTRYACVPGTTAEPERVKATFDSARTSGRIRCSRSLAGVPFILR